MKSFFKTYILQSNSLKRAVLPIYTFINNCKNKIKGKRIYRRNKKTYSKLNRYDNFRVVRKNCFPCLTDRYEKAGTLGNYFWQDLWAARLIAENNPKSHFDIGSRVDGFVGHLASFRDNIKLIDIRALENVIPGVEFVQADATELKEIEDSSVESLSALCSLEHFGLGRYGDPIDPEACFKAMKAIQRVVMKGGNIYIAVPIGHEHLEFDAHRVFFASTIVDTFDSCKLVEFSCIHASDKVIEKNVDIHKYDNDKEIGGGRFGLFHFLKC